MTEAGPVTYICEADVEKMEESLVWKSRLAKEEHASTEPLSLPPGAHRDDGGAESSAAWRGETTTPEEDPTARQKRLKRQRNIQNSFRIWVEDADEVGL